MLIDDLTSEGLTFAGALALLPRKGVDPMVELTLGVALGSMTEEQCSALGRQAVMWAVETERDAELGPEERQRRLESLALLRGVVAGRLYASPLTVRERGDGDARST